MGVGVGEVVGVGVRVGEVVVGEGVGVRRRSFLNEE